MPRALIGLFIGELALIWITLLCFFESRILMKHVAEKHQHWVRVVAIGSACFLFCWSFLLGSWLTLHGWAWIPE